MADFYTFGSGGLQEAVRQVFAKLKTLLDGKYTKPSGGIPKTDLASGVQTSLGLADTAYQKPSSGIPANDLAAGVIPTVPSAYTSNPAMDGTASPGNTGMWADGGHVHPESNKVLNAYDYTTGSGAAVTVASDGNGLALSDVKITLDIQQSGSGTPSYDNIRDITPITALRFTNATKNIALVDNDTSDPANYPPDYTNRSKPKLYGTNGLYTEKTNATGGYNGFMLYNVPAGTYCFSVSVPSSAYNQWQRFIIYGTTDDWTTIVDGEKISFSAIPGSNTRKAGTFMLPNDCTALFVQLFGYDYPTYFDEIQIESGSSPTAFAYPSKTYAVTLQTSDGVYGGEYDPIYGLVTSAFKLTTISSTSSLYHEGTTQYSYRDTSVNPSNEAKSNWAPLNDNTADVWFSVTSQYYNVKINHPGVTSDQLNTMLQTHPLTLVLRLKTPVTFYVGPISVLLGLGNNVISSPNGDVYVVGGQYFAALAANAEAQVDGLTRTIAKEIDGFTADTNLVANDFRIIAGQLYRITANIASGSAITPGVNAELTTVAANLSEASAKADPTSVPAAASVSTSGAMTFSNSGGTALFTVQLPLYTGGVT